MAAAFRDISSIMLKHFEQRGFKSQTESGDARTFLEDYWATCERYGWDKEQGAKFFPHVVAPAIWMQLKLQANAVSPTSEQIEEHFPAVANPGGQAQWNRVYMELRQREDENVTDFYSRYIQAARNAHPAWDLATLQKDFLNFEQRLSLPILRLYQAGAKTLTEAFQAATRAEGQQAAIKAAEARSAPINVPPPPATIAAVEEPTCYVCGQPGHFARGCAKGERRGMRRGRGRGRGRGRRHPYLTASSSQYTNSTTTNVISAVDGKNGRVLRVPLKVNNLQTTAVIDSGAAVCIGDHILLRKAVSGKSMLQKANPRLQSISGQPLDTLGTYLVDLQLDGRIFDAVPIIVVRGLPESHRLVLGCDFLNRARALPHVAEGRLVFDDDFRVAAVEPAATNSFIDEIDFGDVAQTNLAAWKELCNEYSPIWASGPDDYGSARVKPLYFKMNDESPFYAPRMDLPYAHVEELQRQADEWCRTGRITKIEDATFSSAAFPVPKPHSNELRTVINFKPHLNKRIPLLAYVLPTMRQVLEVHTGSDVFSSVDLQHAFLQIPLDERVKKFTAFFIPGRGTFMFNFMPFGLNIAPIYLQQVLDQLFQHVKSVSGYADDWCSSGRGEGNALANLRSLFQCVLSAGIKLKPKKCKLGHSKILLLGRQLSASGIEIPDDERATIQAWPAPKDFSQLAAFRGKVQWIAEHLPSFNNVMTPLARKRIGKEWKWGPEQRAAFQAVKDALCKALPLALPTRDGKFTLEVDASRTGFGAILSQNGRPIRFASRQTTQTEAGLQATQLELAAAVWSIEYFSKYLLGRRFELISDHRALSWIGKLKSPQRKLALWSASLTQFEFDVTYRPGEDHGAADALSRSFTVPVIGLADWQPDDMPTKAELTQAQRQDPDCAAKLDALVAGDKDLLARDFILDVDGILCKIKFWYDYPALLPVIPPTLRPRTLKAVHERAAHSAKGTATLLKTNFFWKGAAEEAERFSKRCEACQHRKSSTGPRQIPQGTVIATAVNDIIACDLMSGLPASVEGFDTVLVIQDYFSRYRVAVPLRSKTAAETATAFERAWLSPFPGVRSLLTDQGGEFTGQEFANVLRRHGIKHIFTSGHFPHGDGLVENSNRWIADGLATTLEALRMKGKEWPKLLANTMLGLNSAPASATGLVPFFIFHHRPPPSLSPLQPVLPTPAQAAQATEFTNKATEHVRHRQLARAQQTEQNNAQLQRVYDFKIQDLVMVYLPRIRKATTSKLDSPWIGPCRILQIKDPLHVVVELLKSGFNRFCQGFWGTVHLSRVKPWQGSNSPNNAPPPTHVPFKPTQPLNQQPITLQYDGNKIPKPPHAQPKARGSQWWNPTLRQVATTSASTSVNLTSIPTSSKLQLPAPTVRAGPVTRSASKILLRGPP